MSADSSETSDENNATVGNCTLKPTIDVRFCGLHNQKFFMLSCVRGSELWMCVQCSLSRAENHIRRVSSGFLMHPSTIPQKAIIKETQLVELELMSTIRISGGHPNLPVLLDYFLVYDNSGFVWIAMEEYQRKTVYDCVIEQLALPMHVCKKWMLQVLSAVSYIHQMGFVHRDLKPQNFLIDADGETVRVIDFDLSSVWKPTDPLLCDYPGTALYSPTEVLRGRPYHGHYRDIYSLGICMYVMCSGFFPFGVTDQNQDDMLRVLREHRGVDCIQVLRSKPAYVLNWITAATRSDPTKRASIQLLTESLHTNTWTE